MNIEDFGERVRPLPCKIVFETTPGTPDAVLRSLNMPAQLLDGDSNYSSAAADAAIWRARFGFRCQWCGVPITSGQAVLAGGCPDCARKR